MGHKEHSNSSATPDVEHLVLQSLAGECIQGGKGLIHQQDIGTRSQCPGNGDALLHPSGKFMWPLALITGQTDQVKGVARYVVCLSRRHSLDPGAEGNVVHYAHPGEEPRLLEHHPAIGCGTCDGDSVNEDTAFTWVCKASYEIEQGALAATGWADDGDELTSPDVEVNSGEDKRIWVVAEPLTYGFETYRGSVSTGRHGWVVRSLLRTTQHG